MPSPSPVVFSRRVLARLWEAELAEPNPHFATDIRIAWITVWFAVCGYHAPHVAACYAVLGLHPKKVWPAIVARRRAQLGPFYAEFWGEGLPPKKPPQSVGLPLEVEARIVNAGTSPPNKNGAGVGSPAPLSRKSRAAVEMASTAREYRNSGPRESENSRFTLPTLVEASNWPAAYQALLLAMLEKNKFGTECFRSTSKLARQLRCSYSTAKRMIDRLENGWRDKQGVLTLVYEANARPGGKLRRARTYRIEPQKFQRWPTEQEHDDQSRGALCPMRPKPPQPHPEPPKSPAGNGHRSNGGGITRNEQRLQVRRATVAAEIGRLMKNGLPRETAVLKCCPVFGMTAAEINADLDAVHFVEPEKAKPIPPPGKHDGSPWQDILKRLEGKINPHSFETWLRPTRFDHQDAGVLYVRIPTAEFRHVRDKYADKIADACDELGLEYRDVKFVTGEEDQGP